MKYLHKLGIGVICLLIGYEGNIFAYTFSIANMTGKDVKAHVHLRSVMGKSISKEIKAYKTRYFSFTGRWSGYCLKKITVSTKKGNEWSKAQEAKIRVPVSENRFKFLRKLGLIGRVGEEYAILIGMSMCTSRDFVLIIDQESKKIYAVTGLEV